MKKAFTIIELVVAIALMVMVVSFSGTIFKVSIDAHRVAAANAEIMHKMRSITEQLNSDFRGLRRNAPLLIRFDLRRGSENRRFDQIMFFADGDFQSTQLYSDPSLGRRIPDEPGTPIKGNVARIDYGLDKELDLFASRRHILTLDTELDPWLDAQNLAYENVVDYFLAPDRYGRGIKSELYEHDSLSLAHWKTIEKRVYDEPRFYNVYFESSRVDMTDPNTYHKLICGDVDSFAIQWAYWDPGIDNVKGTRDDKLRWYPSDDPDNDGDNDDSQFFIVSQDFDREDLTDFGVYFNTPGTGGKSAEPFWYDMKYKVVEYRPGEFFPSNFYPKALKFTFKIYDSKGIIEGGRTFTHIVYIGG